MPLRSPGRQQFRACAGGIFVDPASRPRERGDEAVAYPLPPLPGVTPLTVEVREVYASA